MGIRYNTFALARRERASGALMWHGWASLLGLVARVRMRVWEGVADATTDDQTIADCLETQMLEAVHTLMASGDKIPYSDAGVETIAAVYKRTVDNMPQEHLDWLARKAAAMTPEDWDAFSDGMIREVRPEDLDPRRHKGFEVRYVRKERD